MALGAWALPVLAAENRPGKVIDAAVHFYDPDRPQGVPWPGSNSTLLYKRTYPDRYLAAIKPFTVDGVIAIEASPWLEDNLWLLNVADRNPLIRAVVGNIPPGHPDFSAALDRFGKHPLFRGIRINAGLLPRILAQPELLQDLKRLSDKDLHLDILVSSPSFAQIAELAARLPDLRMVVGHLPLDSPKDAPGRAKFVEGLWACSKHDRVFAKVSGVVRRIGDGVPADAAWYKPQLDELWDIFGPDRVIYASNWPASDVIAAYPVVYRVVLDYVSNRGKEEIEKFFWKNSLVAYKWKDNA
jgi:L-fuconolactonase